MAHGLTGLLAGAGTGAVHGPWFKLPGHGEKEEGAKQSNDDKDEKDASE